MAQGEEIIFRQTLIQQRLAEILDSEGVSLAETKKEAPRIAGGLNF
jgi:hypothetical protein